jgi:hypothetical protein
MFHPPDQLSGLAIPALFKYIKILGHRKHLHFLDGLGNILGHSDIIARVNFKRKIVKLGLWLKKSADL